MSRRPSLLLGIVGALSLVALVETVNALLAKTRVATDADWQAAAAAVRADLKPHDLITFAPAWVDSIGRAHLDVPLPMVGRSDADRYDRIWELAIRDAHTPDAAGARVVKREQHGKVRVTLYEKPAVSVLWEAPAAFEHARVVQTLGTAEPTPCLLDGTEFRCASTRVARRTLEIDYRPRYGILVPVDGARTTRMSFDELPTGGTLIFYAGLHDYYARKSADGRVAFTVLIDGRQVLASDVGNEDGWRRFAVDTHDLPPGTHQLEVAARAERAAWRNFGFFAELRQ